jgi:hypothetical protein
MLTNAGDIAVTETELRVTFAPLSSPHRTAALAALCAGLDALAPRSPAPGCASATPSRPRNRTLSPRGRSGGLESGLECDGVRTDLGRSRGSPVTSRSRRTRLTLTACSQSGAHHEPPFGIYIPGSRRETGGLGCQAHHLDSTVPAAATAPHHVDHQRCRLAMHLQPCDTAPCAL